MNGTRRRVILYGNSLILQGVRASLATRQDIEIVVLDPPLQSPPEEIAAYSPTAVIFDMGDIQPQLLLGLFQQPGVLLVGMEIETRQALVWCGRQAAAVVAADLLEMLVEGKGES